MPLKDLQNLFTSQRSLPHWLFAIGAMLAAAAVAAILPQHFGREPVVFLWFLPSIAVAALFSGFAQGIVASLMGAVGGWWLSGLSAEMAALPPNLTELFLLLAFGLAISALGGMLHSRRRPQSPPQDADAELRHTKSHLRSVLDNSPALISIKDLEGRIVAVNRRLLDMLGKPSENVVGRNVHELLPRDVADRLWHSDQRALRAGVLQHQVEELLHKDGQCRTYMAARFPITHLDTEQQLGVCSMWVDISAQKKAEEQLVHVAQHDALTGLPNRALVYEFGDLLLGAARRGKGKLAVLFFDLERFKSLNDAYGREAGDGMLQEIARRLRRNVRSSDLVGRMGSDEFVVILSDVQSSQDLANSAAHLRETLAQPYSAEDYVLRASPSIGISLYPDDGNDIDTLIRNADVAMRHARDNAQVGYQFFTPAIQQNIRQEIAIEQRLRAGIEHDEFELYYQPVVDTRTRRIVGAEALIRWPQADGVIMQPNEFIQVAEANGVINQLGTWVIQEACRQIQQWRRQGLPPLRIAVNVSPVQFRARNFYQRVADAVTRSGIDPSCLELEVTESALMKKADEASQTLASLKALGLQIALDDFGTGYSSLSRLAGLPFDKLKVDQSFIRNIVSDSRSLAVTETVIALGKRLGVKVVAEGIETEAAFSLLRECKCDLGQGYLLSKPMPADQFRRWHQQHILAAG
ncbi:EAL domain-containing protein [Janthinobacterium sp. 17J80-10]|uniref:putative bifunctional diguanylate cyclase/phosphodiesterase n=1 Tax=Janthinobacterium sp. 17J80-10 TaxID=2497863 RepID=UPI0013E8F2B1|nr:EAL domain-containing protein [Janthinobacterium sp. 17J80-10]